MRSVTPLFVLGLLLPLAACASGGTAESTPTSSTSTTTEAAAVSTTTTTEVDPPSGVADFGDGRRFELTLLAIEFPIERDGVPAPPETVALRAQVRVRSLYREREVLFPADKAAWLLAGPRNVTLSGPGSVSLGTECSEPREFGAYQIWVNDYLDDFADRCLYDVDANVSLGTMFRMAPGTTRDMSLELDRGRIFIPEQYADPSLWTLMYGGGMEKGFGEGDDPPVMLRGAEL